MPLHRKRLTSEHHPRIDLLINERVVEELDFTIRLKLDFAGAQLTTANPGVSNSAISVGVEGFYTRIPIFVKT